MYYHQQRYHDDRVLVLGPNDTDRVVCQAQAQYTYSWRTNVPRDRFDPEGSTFGIRPPLKKGSVYSLVKDRQRYLTEIADTSANWRNPAPPRGKAFPTHDTGHNFTSVKWTSIPATIASYQRGKPNWVGPAWTVGVAILPPSVASPGFPSSRPKGVFPSDLQIKGGVNSMFSSMAPSDRQAQIGETLVALMRGEVPTVLKNLKRAIKKGKAEWLSAAGREHLNIQFGWLPLISEIQSVIKTLLTLDELIYGGSDRRIRNYEYTPLIESRTDTVVSSSGYNSRGPRYHNRYYGLVSKYPVTIRATTDLRLSARLTPVARPTIKSKDFVSQAGDVLLKLGAWYPGLGWDLLPYSWLVDWFVHLGQAIDRVATYGSKPGQTNVDYAWCNQRSVYTVTGHFSNLAGGTLVVRPTVMETTVTNHRFQGTPFGFGTTYSGLNAWQVSILVALGLARVS